MSKCFILAAWEAISQISNGFYILPVGCAPGGLRQIGKLTGLPNSRSVTSEDKGIRYKYPLPDSRTFNAKTASKNQFLNRPLNSLLAPSLHRPIALPFQQLRMLARQGFNGDRDRHLQSAVAIGFSRQKQLPERVEHRTHSDNRYFSNIQCIES